MHSLHLAHAQQKHFHITTDRFVSDYRSAWHSCNGKSRGSRRDFLKHGVRVDAAWIVVFFDSLSTISVLFPEGNGGCVVSCGFESHLANAARGKFSLRFMQHHGAHTVVTVWLKDIDRDDVAPCVIVGGEDESGDVVLRFGYQAVGAWKAKIVAEVAARICDCGLVACLVDGIERFEILRPVFSEAKSQWHGLSVRR